MSYLLDKKIKRNRYVKAMLGVLVLIVLFYFRFGIFNGLSYVAEIIFHPVLVLGRNAGGKFGDIGSYFASKNSLYLQNQNLQSQIKEEELRMSNYNSLLSENDSLKEMLGRKNTKDVAVLAAILAKPNHSVYDTLIIDAGTKDGVKEGDMIFAKGDMPIGRIALAYVNSSKVILFSNAGEKTEAVISRGNIFMELVGRGGGNFEMIMPKGLVLLEGDQAVTPGINPHLLAVVKKIISDPRDPFTKALLTSPVNIQELKFVEVEISAR